VTNLSYRRVALFLDALEQPPEAWQQLTAVVDTVGETIKQARARARARPPVALQRPPARLRWPAPGLTRAAAGRRLRSSARRWGT